MLSEFHQFTAGIFPARIDYSAAGRHASKIDLHNHDLGSMRMSVHINT